MKYYALVITIAIALITLIGFDQTQTNEVAEVATTTTIESTTTTTSTQPPTTTTTILIVAETPQPVSTETFFECVRYRESHGDYTAVNPTGTFMGAYQIYQGGWDTFAESINRYDLIGVPPHTALPADQDAIALAMYNELGAKPWGGACQ